jgi:hypothetical protein
MCDKWPPTSFASRLSDSEAIITKLPTLISRARVILSPTRLCSGLLQVVAGCTVHIRAAAAAAAAAAGQPNGLFTI